MPRRKTVSSRQVRRNLRHLDGNLKRTSALRRMPERGTALYVATAAFEGDVCVFMLARDATPITVEAVSGRAMIVAPGDVFLATAGYRESTRWVVGGIPTGGLTPGGNYWVLAESGVVGDLFGDSPLEKGHLGRAKYLGAVRGDDGRTLNMRQFAVGADGRARDSGAPIFLVLGTSAEVGKTTAGVAVLRSLRQRGLATIIALKATGTSSVTEITTYRDFGAALVFDCVDFGLPTTYPSDRKDIEGVFRRALDTCLTTPADAIIIECGGDILGANVPSFLRCLKRRRPDAKVVLTAADALGALGGKQILEKAGFSVNLITGPCTDTPTLQQRTQAVCGTPAVNTAKGGDIGVLF